MRGSARFVLGIERRPDTVDKHALQELARAKHLHSKWACRTLPGNIAPGRVLILDGFDVTLHSRGIQRLVKQRASTLCRGGAKLVCSSVVAASRLYDMT